ncbi:MAG: SRPBCC family protein [Thiogranum sp.]|nr:SRPBCC family protein [Thiogranum sp.]
MHRKLFVLLALHLMSLSASASQLVRLDVDKQADVYVISVEMLVDAPADNVHAVLTDYANQGRLNASITSSKIIGNARDGTIRVRTRMENCILFFCRNLQIVEDVVEDEQGRILRSVLPESSGLRYGRASWELLSSGDRTRVIHHAQLERDFRIPSWISAILIGTLRREILESFRSLDCLARRQCADCSERVDAGNRDYPASNV